ncbi:MULTISPECIES: hypothetical protein [Polaromonas]|uniref:Uncharacterized protein n=1 Tax=Polaromonas aquatica TaxID=332657 RepID=A0ABW1U0G6_9BURK
MGWLFTNKTRDQLIAMLTRECNNEFVKSKVLEHQLVGNVLWSLVCLTAIHEGCLQLKSGESINFIRCDLLESSPEGWGYKALEESVHPYYYDCPLHYLDLAPEQSADWRVNVRQFHAQDAQKSKPLHHP